jgi:MerR family copper efflux transcriptional regulator
MEARAMQTMTIGKAAREAGVNIETIRFYERRGLIERPPKGNGYRVYSPEEVARIRFIKEAQQIGFSLSEIGDLLSLRADPAADCSEVRRQAVAKLDQVNQKIEQLRAVGVALETLIAACPGRGALQAFSILDGLTLRSTKPPSEEKRSQRRSRQKSAKEHQMETALLKIDGMHCNGCAETIKSVVERQPGVQAAEGREPLSHLATSWWMKRKIWGPRNSPFWPSSVPMALTRSFSRATSVSGFSNSRFRGGCLA